MKNIVMLTLHREDQTQPKELTVLIYFLIYTEQKEQSLKQDDHGEKSIRVSLRKKTHIYREFNVFMRDNESKTETFEVTASGST